MSNHLESLHELNPHMTRCAYKPEAKLPIDCRYLLQPVELRSLMLGNSLEESFESDDTFLKLRAAFLPGFLHESA